MSHNGAQDDIEAFSRYLEPIMTKLAKACLTSRPRDLDVFCYKFFADRLGIDPDGHLLSDRRLLKDGPSSRDVLRGGKAADNDLDDDEEASEADYMAAKIRSKSRRVIQRKKNYESTDDDDDTTETSPVSDNERVSKKQVNVNGSARRRVTDLRDGIRSSNSIEDTESIKTSESFGSRGGSKFYCSDEVLDTDEEEVFRGDIQELDETPDRSSPSTHHHPILDVASGKAAQLELQVRIARRDPRMRLLFETWDDDGNGSVDLMELVVALHKFNRVTEEGTDLSRASQALVLTSNESAEGSHELTMDEFTRFICHFCDEAFDKPFADIADHMLAVANASSERAALAAANGGDISQIVADDEADAELLRETVLGVADSVASNIVRIKTNRRVGFEY